MTQRNFLAVAGIALAGIGCNVDSYNCAFPSRDFSIGIVDDSLNEETSQVYANRIVEINGSIINPESALGRHDQRSAFITSNLGLGSLVFGFDGEIKGKIRIYQGEEADLPDQPYSCSVADVFLSRNTGNGREEFYACSLDGRFSGYRTFDISRTANEAGGGITEISIRQVNCGTIKIDAVSCFD